MTDSTTASAAFDDERGDEVDDYTGDVPRPPAAVDAGSGDSDGDEPSGFGDGDVADVDDEQPASSATPMADLEAIVAERDQIKDLAVRLQADFENFRRRTATQQEAEIERATGRLAEALLPVLDAAEAAYVQHPDEVGPLFSLMLTELKRHGLEALDLAGHPFDPEVAEAVAHEPAAGGAVVVAEVLRSGYRWKGRTLRPAMVRTRD
jgi:molecular chaperone GrpE